MDIKKVLLDRGITAADIQNKMLPMLHSNNVVSSTLKRLGGEQLIGKLETFGSQIASELGGSNSANTSGVQNNASKSVNGGNPFPPLKK